jgi:hypothetical protein
MKERKMNELMGSLPRRIYDKVTINAKIFLN